MAQGPINPTGRLAGWWGRSREDGDGVGVGREVIKKTCVGPVVGTTRLCEWFLQSLPGFMVQGVK
jgi:hypothetical protein